MSHKLNAALVKVPYSIPDRNGEVREGFSLQLEIQGLVIKLRKDKFASEDTYNYLFFLADSVDDEVE